MISRPTNLWVWRESILSSQVIPSHLLLAATLETVWWTLSLPLSQQHAGACPSTNSHIYESHFPHSIIIVVSHQVLQTQHYDILHKIYNYKLLLKVALWHEVAFNGMKMPWTFNNMKLHECVQTLLSCRSAGDEAEATGTLLACEAQIQGHFVEFQWMKTLYVSEISMKDGYDKLQK